MVRRFTALKSHMFEDASSEIGNIKVVRLELSEITILLIVDVELNVGEN